MATSDGLRDEDESVSRRVLRRELVGRDVKATGDPVPEEIVEGEKW